MPTVPRFLEEITQHTKGFADAVRAAGHDAPVPSCPDWTVRDLADHLGGVHRWCTVTVGNPGTKLQRRGATTPPMPDDESEVSLWLLEGAAALVQAIRDAGEDTLVGGFGGPVPVSFWARRQCHETLVHRADAEIAAGVLPLTDVDPVIAADAVDEHLEMVARGAKRRPDLRADGATLHLHATDEGLGEDRTRSNQGSTPIGELDHRLGEWVVTLGADGPTIEHAHRKSDTAVRGPARALLTVLTAREGPEVAGVDVLGAPDLLTRWREHGAV
ncbi:maleylpyruvate isomerase family mycothiol-dependent enzyme [Actinomycetospora lutea]|uniref:maleylpyruvate isomerase family mycothiol-dependent enzyme n=1 Tax=Actinomycetospora lutea TaxID=663604 RepID=UPI002364FCD6|nr:maleylpyruvate isomerase family mycothiol-dependent enzyme [Actinomycetospora lutea]MDD7939253.1 maleylpyruvate isomerase family mycothiol-dependent enzyme [Actinomycetospora lutea]